jgi:hypothetical protein
MASAPARLPRERTGVRQLYTLARMCSRPRYSVMADLIPALPVGYGVAHALFKSWL